MAKNNKEFWHSKGKLNFPADLDESTADALSKEKLLKEYVAGKQLEKILDIIASTCFIFLLYKIFSWNMTAGTITLFIITFVFSIGTNRYCKDLKKKACGGKGEV